MKKEQIRTLLKKKTNLNISEIAKSLDTKRELLYQSIDGKGSRALRVAIALKIGRKPSDIWSKNSQNVKVLDDHEYNKSMANA